MTLVDRGQRGAKRLLQILMVTGVASGCSSLGDFEYGDGDADRFTAGDVDTPYVPDDDDDDATSGTPPASGTSADPTDGTATDLGLEPAESSSSSDGGTQGSGTGEETDAGTSTGDDTGEPTTETDGGSSGEGEPGDPQPEDVPATTGEATTGVPE